MASSGLHMLTIRMLLEHSAMVTLGEEAILCFPSSSSQWYTHKQLFHPYWGPSVWHNNSEAVGYLDSSVSMHHMINTYGFNITWR